MEFVLPLFLLILTAAVCGTLVRLAKLPPFLGYIVGGLVFGTVVPPAVRNIAKLSEVGTIFLLFSIGLELSFSRLSKFFKVAIFGAIAQIIAVSLISFFVLKALGLEVVPAIILSAGFSLSSTALVVKVLADRGEIDTLHGGVMTGWLLVQDLAVVPMMVVLPLLGVWANLWGSLGLSLLKSFIIVFLAIVLGKSLVPFLIHKIASTNSRELLVLASVALAMGVAVITYLFGISPALGAFLAGIAISETQEHHAVFAEIRPLRDLFVALFFVSLGFLISPSVLFSKLGLILLIAFGVLLLKSVVVFLTTAALGFRGRSAVVASMGLSQIGEFALVIYSSALAMGKLSGEDTSLGIAVTLVTLLIAPFLMRAATPLWRRLKSVSGFFSSGQRVLSGGVILENHIIICGYGRVGSWVGKVLMEFGIPFVVVEYNENVAANLKEKGIDVIYGDPAETEIMEAANIRGAKALVLAIPDIVAQENLIAYAQTVSPHLKIITRAHDEEDLEKLRVLGVDKIVQPEFEAAVAIIRGILSSMGKNKDEITDVVKKIRISHAKN